MSAAWTESVISVKAAKTAIDSPSGRSARRSSTAAATTTVVLIQNAPIRKIHHGLILRRRANQPGSLGTSFVRAGRPLQNQPAAASRKTPRVACTALAAVVGVPFLAKSDEPKKSKINKPTAKVDNVQPAIHASELDR